MQADQDPAPGVCARPQPLQNQQLGVRVQTGNRLIGDQERRRNRQGARQKHACAFAARHIGHAAIGQMADADLVQRGAGALQRRSPGEERRAQRRHFDGRQVPGDGTVLRQIGRALAPLAFRQTPGLVAAQTSGPLGQRGQAKGGANRRRLARPVRSAQGDDFAWPDEEGRAFQNLDPAEARVGVLKLQQPAHSRHSRAARHAIRANSGAPTRAVNTPSFSS